MQGVYRMYCALDRQPPYAQEDFQEEEEILRDIKLMFIHLLRRSDKILVCTGVLLCHSAYACCVVIGVLYTRGPVHEPDSLSTGNLAKFRVKPVCP